jgi:hypothetical protein
LNSALEVVAKCEGLPNKTERDIRGLAMAKQETERELRDRTAAYQAWWKTAKGRDPAPDEDEWYQIEEARQVAAGENWIYGIPHFTASIGKYFRHALSN